MSVKRRTTNGVYELFKEFLDAYVEMWKRSFDFTGLTSRRKYWMAFAISVPVTYLIFGLLTFLVESGPFDALASFVLFVSFVHSASMGTRRVRDVRGSGWWYLLVFIPFGAFLLLVWFASPSKVKSDS